MRIARREIIRMALLWGATFAGLKSMLGFAADAKKPVAENDPVASSLGYRQDAKKVDTKKFPQRKTPEGKKQFCDNCMFYSKIDDKWGSCQVIQAGTVAAKGWCMSWAKKS